MYGGNYNKSTIFINSDIPQEYPGLLGGLGLGFLVTLVNGSSRLLMSQGAPSWNSEVGALNTCLCESVFICKYMDVYVCIYASMYICVYVYAHVLVCIYVSIIEYVVFKFYKTCIRF